MTKITESLIEQGLLTPETAPVMPDATLDTNEGTFTMVDADTFKGPDGQKFRMLGLDARETDHTVFGDEGQPIGIKAGDLGGSEEQARVMALAKSQGYTNVRRSGNFDAYGRELIDLTNDAGDNFSDRLVAEGVIKPGTTSDRHQQQAKYTAFADLAKQMRKANGEPNEFDKAADWLDEFIGEQSGDPMFRFRALNEEQLESARLAEHHDPTYRNPYSKAGVQFRSGDRYLDNKAKNPLSVSFDQGLKGAMAGLAGPAELIGHELGFEGLENWAEGRKEGYEYDIAAMPSTLVDYKNVDGFGDAVEYVGNLAALSLPYMLTTMGAAALAPATGGLSLAAPAGIYAGQVWNEMGDTDETEKNAALAISAGITMATLDRLGLQGIARTSLLSKAGQQEAMRNAVKAGIPPQAIVRASKLEMAKFSGDAARFAKDQLATRNILRSVLQGAAVGSTSEGLTEVAQESVAYLAAVAGSDKEFNEKEMLERLQDAAIGGAVLGGAFTVPGMARDVGGWVDVAYREAPADAARLARQERWAQQEVDTFGRVRSTEEVARGAQGDVFGQSLSERAEIEQGRRKATGTRDTFGEMLKDIPGLWRGSVRHIFNNNLQDRSLAARELASIFGGNLERYLSGQTFETAKHLQLAEYKNLMDTPVKIAQDFGFPITRKGRGELSNLIYKAYAQADKDKAGVPNWDSLAGTEYEQYIKPLKEFDHQAQRMTDRLWLDQKKHNPDLGREEAYAFKHRALDKAKIERDRQGFEKDLVAKFGLQEHEASNLVENILYSDSVNTVEAAFSVAERRDHAPGSHRERTLGLSEDHEFAAKWMDDNIFNNLSEMAKSAARYKGYQEYVGPNGSVISNKLNQMEQELIESGMPEVEAKQAVNKAALGMKNYLDAESGNYNRPTSDAGKMFNKVQRGIMTYTTLAGLPLATLSSLVELALTYKSLKPEQIPAISKQGKEFAAMFANFYNDKDFGTEGRRHLRDLGFMEWEVGAAAVTGVTEYNNRSKDMMDRFFKIIGLKQWTDFTRALRGSFAQDYIAEKMDIISNIDPNNVTNADQEAQTALRNLGFNIEDMMPIWERMGTGAPLTEQESQIYDNNMRNAIFSWINDAVVLPGAANRPLFYQDPRFALFTQFQGFIATFTANVLPKLYKQAFAGQTPAMKYNAFAVMTTMMMLAFASQYLKDLIKYGQTTPYLDDAEQIQRAVNSSGLLGTGERVLNLINPLYEQRYDTSLGWFFGTATGESPAITNIIKGTETLGAAGEGDIEKAYRKGWKLIPGLGPLNSLRDQGGEIIFGE